MKKNTFNVIQRHSLINALARLRCDVGLSVNEVWHENRLSKIESAAIRTEHGYNINWPSVNLATNKKVDLANTDAELFSYVKYE